MAPSKTSALPIDLTANTTAYREAITGKKAITPQKADHLVATLYYSLGKEILAWQKAGKTPDELEGIATHYVAGFLAGTGDYYQHHPVEPLPRPSEANGA